MSANDGCAIVGASQSVGRSAAIRPTTVASSPRLRWQ